jgi:antibiotic biosynthesis monooxygenase (ABM) superfamily enzyme
MEPPKKHKMALLVWCAIYPTINLIFFVFGLFLETLPPLLKTLFITFLLVPLMVYVFLPFIMKNFHDWLRK